MVAAGLVQQGLAPGVSGGLTTAEDVTAASGEDKSPILNNPAFSHSNCPPEVHKSCFCVRFIAEHTRMLEESTKVRLKI